MFNNRKLFIRGALVLTGLLGACAANAQRTTCLYSVANIQGAYADVVTFGAGQGSGLMTAQFDGNGTGTTTGTDNVPTTGSTTGGRTIVTVSASFTYTVNCDGTGQISVTLTLPNGGTEQVLLDFVITKAVSVNGVLVATTIQAAQEEPSFLIPGGVFVTHVYTLQIDPVAPPVQEPEKLHRQRNQY